MNNIRINSMLLMPFWLSCLICGCEDHLIYVHETSLGLDVAVSTEGTGRLVFGYDRDTYALVPRKDERQEAMSVTALGCIYAQGLDEVHFDHFVSTGEAALKIAQAEQTLQKINLAINGGGDKCVPQK
jgi:hypothetical protein